MKNQEIARIFFEIANLLEIKGIKFKPFAYRKAARTIQSLNEDIKDIIAKKEKIPGIGKHLTEKIIEFIETGKIKAFEKLKKEIPIKEELMNVPFLGPKKTIKLYKELNIKNLKELEQAAKKRKIRTLKGFKEKTEKNILEGIKLVKAGKKRILLGKALPIAREIINELKKLKEVKKISEAGSLRRRKETIGDIDLLVAGKKRKKIMNYFTSLKEVKKVLMKGNTKSSVLLENNIQVDLRILKEKEFGSALQYFTGSKEHNIMLRNIAIKKGLKLNEYGLFEKKTRKRIAGKNEKEIYNKLGMQLIPPELREARGEIESARKKMIPRLIELKDIKGDFQCHTNYSDGSNSIKEMILTAKSLGYEFLCITDHSKSEKIAHGMKEETLLKYIREIKKTRKKIKGIKVFIGAEVDILKNGELDYDDEILKKLDVVSVAIHSGFKMPKQKMTERIITGLSNNKVKIFFHPTGRLINKRNPYEVDLEKIMNYCKEKNIAMEINAFPERLDLSDLNTRKAIEKKVNLVLGTDAHNTRQLHYMEYGVSVARRAGARKKNIINSWDLKKIIKWLKTK